MRAAVHASLIRNEVILARCPTVSGCPIHLRSLTPRCRCGADFRPFRHQGPFTCHGCGRHYRELPSTRVRGTEAQACSLGSSRHLVSLPWMIAVDMREPVLAPKLRQRDLRWAALPARRPACSLRPPLVRIATSGTLGERLVGSVLSDDPPRNW